MEGQITVPIIGHFISLITTLFLIIITCPQAFPKAKMLNYNIYYFQRGNLLDLCQVSLPKIAKHWDGFLSDCNIQHLIEHLGRKTKCMY